jgi:hypothetical protein
MLVFDFARGIGVRLESEGLNCPSIAPTKIQQEAVFPIKITTSSSLPQSHNNSSQSPILTSLES